jgi:hypothetical protein
MLGDNGSRTSCGYAMLLIYLLNANLTLYFYF